MNTLSLILFVVATILLALLMAFKDHDLFNDPEYSAPFWLDWLSPEQRFTLFVVLIIVVYLIAFYYACGETRSVSSKANMDEPPFSRLRSDEELLRLQLQYQLLPADLPEGAKISQGGLGKHHGVLPPNPQQPPMSQVTHKEYPSQQRSTLEENCIQLSKHLTGENEKKLFKNICEPIAKNIQKKVQKGIDPTQDEIRLLTKYSQN